MASYSLPEVEEICGVVKAACKAGDVVITKIANTPANLGKSPQLVFLEQLYRLGYVVKIGAKSG